MDLTISFAVIVFFFPALALIALLIKLDSSGPVFYRQRRLGREGKAFSIFKFRTMVNGAEKIGLKKSTARDDGRITRVGKVLRNSSIDELPQILNVIKGEMSIVGPRPAFMEYLDKYTHRQERRLEVHPGLTGWAQVNGRNALTWQERIEHDVWYVENRNLWLNISTIFRTLPVLFKSELVYGPVVNFELEQKPAFESVTESPELHHVYGGKAPVRKPKEEKIPLGV